MTPTEVLRWAQQRQGWTVETALDVVLGFVEDEGGLAQERFRQYVRNRVRGDAEASGEDEGDEPEASSQVHVSTRQVVSQTAVGRGIVQIASVDGDAVVNQTVGDVTIQIGRRRP